MTRKLSPEEAFQRQIYRPLCSEEEISRILAAKNARDFLLKVRADAAVDNMRLLRVFIAMRRIIGDKYKLSTVFSDSHYRFFLRHLPDGLQRKCSNATYGDVLSVNTNGTIFKSPYGPVVTLSRSLNYFLKFMHLGILNLDDDVPMEVRFNAIRIAVRVMLKTETLDFLMDPRGVIPKRVAEEMHEPIKWQLAFLAGHEFAHLALGHLDDLDTVEEPTFYAISSNSSGPTTATVYNTSQQREFEADLWALSIPLFSSKDRYRMIRSALLFFGCLEIFEAVQDAISPQIPWAYRSHPSARQRLDNLTENLELPYELRHGEMEGFFDTIASIKRYLLEDVSLNIETYEVYGSLYLSAPDTKWRGRELLDRIDF